MIIIEQEVSTGSLLNSLPTIIITMAFDQNALEGLRIERENSTSASKPKRGLLSHALLGGTLVLLAAITWWFFSGEAVEVEILSVSAPNSASNNNASSVLDASGYVIARRKSTISAKVTARIMEVLIEEGDYVTEGQLLARLDPSTYSRQLDLSRRQHEAAQAQLAQVQVRLLEAERTVQRAEKLGSSNLISEAELERARANVDDFRAQLDALRSQVKVAQANVGMQQQNMDDLLVRAPFSGVVISKDAQPGEMVSPTSAGGGFTRTGIATIVDMESREIEVDVNESFIQRVSENQSTIASLDAYPDLSIPSHVISIVPTADRQKATVKVRIGFDELDDRVLPDMAVKVRFLSADSASEQDVSAARVELPGSALFSENDLRYVWRVRNQQLERVAVKTGAESNGNIRILSGIQPGDQIVKNVTAALHDGLKVKRHSR